MHITRPLTLLSLLTLSACTQSYSHAGNLALSPDGNTLALLRPDRPPTSITLLSLNTGTATNVPLPAGHSTKEFLWLDSRLYLSTQDRQNAAAYIYAPATNSWSPAPYVISLWYPIYLARYKQSPALFQTLNGTNVFSAHDLSPVATLPDTLRGLRDSYSLRYHRPEVDGSHTLRYLGPTWDFRNNAPPIMGADTPDLSQIELLDPDFKSLLTLTREQAAAQGYPLIDNQSQLSPDHRTLMFTPEILPHGGSGNMDTVWSLYRNGFTVIDVASGKLLYKVPGHPAALDSTGRPHGTIVAPPILTNDAVYAIEECVPPPAPLTNPPAPPRKPGKKDHQFWLYRFTATTADPVLQLPLTPAMLFPITSPQTTTPDATSLLIYTAIPTPRILKVPLRKDTTPADIQSFNL